jgi:hypothetical protein
MNLTSLVSGGKKVLFCFRLQTREKRALFRRVKLQKSRVQLHKIVAESHFVFVRLSFKQKTSKQFPPFQFLFFFSFLVLISPSHKSAVGGATKMLFGTAEIQLQHTHFIKTPPFNSLATAKTSDLCKSAISCTSTVPSPA